MEDVTVDIQQNNELTTSDILQQALQEASQNNVQTVFSSDADVNVCSLDEQKLLELSENANHADLNVTFSDGTNGNLISIPDGISMDSFTVPVFTTESNDSVALTLGNLPITSVTETVTLNIANNTVTFPCTLPIDSDSSEILNSAGLLDQDSGGTVKATVELLNAFEVESMSDSAKISETFTADLETVQSDAPETTNAQVTTEEILPALMLPQPKDVAAPIGSSENPIQIVQHGTTYHSTQMLNHEQLAQIAQVLQQQQISKSMEKGRSAVLYNPSTNTRIIYRVVYPPSVHAKLGDSKKSAEARNNPPGKGRGRSRKTWSRRFEDERKVEGPDMSREEKEERKKHRPRTRSGRISKPPSYMIKDYKRIHHLDFNEDPQNDSDGGYSDFHLSEEELQGEDKDGRELPFGVSTVKPRNYKCSTCDKAYIGRGGLARHYRLTAGHGSMPPDEGEELNDMGLSDENSNASLVSESSQPLTECRLKELSAGLSNDDEEAQVSPSGPAKDPQVLKQKDQQQLAHLMKKKAKLKELIQPFCDADLLEVVMPRLSQAITLWEFLLLKSEKGDPSIPHVPDIFRHFEDLLNRLQRLAQDCLVLTSSSANSTTANVALSASSNSPPLTPLMTDENKVYVEITNDRVGQVLGVSTGLYEVVQWKLLQHVPSLMKGPSQSQKRPATSLLATTNRKRTKKNQTTISGMFNNGSSVNVRDPVLREDSSSSMATFQVEENSQMELNPAMSNNATILNKAVSILQDQQNSEQFSVIASQSQDSSFSSSLDSSCHVTSAEEIPCLSISNDVSLTQGLIFSTASVTNSINLPSLNTSKTTGLDLSGLTKLNLLGSLPNEKSDETILKLIGNMPSIQVKKVNLFPKDSNLLSLVQTEMARSEKACNLDMTGVHERTMLKDSELLLSSTEAIQSGSSFLKDSDSVQMTDTFLKDATLLRTNAPSGSGFLKGDDSTNVFLKDSGSVQSNAGFIKDSELLSVHRTELPKTMIEVPSSIQVSSSLLSLLNETPIVMDVASLKTTPLTVMSTNMSLSSIPSLDTLLTQTAFSQFRIAEESSTVLQEVLRLDETKELECPNTSLTNPNDDLPVVQLVVPEQSNGILNSFSASSSSNTFETLDSTESVSNSLLPSNVVIVQNEDGTTTLQLPTDQPFSLETIQALLAMDHNLAAEILKDDHNTPLEKSKLWLNIV